MIAVLREMIPDLLVVGLDRSMDLLQAGNHTVFWPLLAEATRLPTLSASFDVISATAIIEHLCNPSYMLRDCHRVLRPGGIIAITTPVPFFERIGTWIGHLPKEQHMHTFDLALLSTMLIQAGFKILEAERFMLSPIGFPCELRIERALKQLGGGKFLLNQIIIGQRLPDQGHGKSIKFSRIAPKYY
jgi:ubiquinone/menaquinone biosynthesis C-methylase UbiE